MGLVAGIATLSTLGYMNTVLADTVNILNSTTVTTTGSGAANIPSVASFNIPAGRNRVIFVVPMFERDHCLLAANCLTTNTAGTGLGSNWAEPTLSSLNSSTLGANQPQITARFTGTGGTVNKKNALVFGGTPDGDLRFTHQSSLIAAPNNLYSKAFFSGESYFIAIYESEIQTLLGSGATSGNISITLPDTVAPKDAGDDAVFMVFVFEGVNQVSSGIVRSGVAITNAASGDPGNFTRSVSAFDAGQAPTQAGDGVLAVSFNFLGLPTSNGGFNTMSGFNSIQSAVTNNNGGVFDSATIPGGANSINSSEPDGMSASAQFRNGIPTLPVTITSSGASNLLVKGGTLALFTLKSATATPDLALTKSDGDLSFTQGSNGTYTLTPRNNGTVATTGTVTIQDTLPAELTYVSATGTGWTCNYNSSTRVVTCTSSTPIAANSNGNPILLTVNASSGGGTTITNTASINGGGEAALDSTNNSASDTTPITMPVYSLSGTVFDDRDGSKLKAFTGEDYTAASITAVLLDGSNNVVSTAAVNGTGAYSFNNLTARTYNVKIIQTPTTALTTGVVIPPANDILPTNWIATGENNSGVIDGTVDRSQTVAITASNITGINFGIEQFPDTTALNPALQPNPGGTATVLVPTLAGTDPEDGALGTGKSFKIVTLPTNGTLYYPNASNVPTAVTVGQVIANYDPTKLTLDPTATGAATVTFTYAAIDAAAQVDPTPATVTMPFSAVAGATSANVLLVKRITAINGDRTKNPNDNTPLNIFKDDTSSTTASNDNNANWKTSPVYLVGAIDAGLVKPGDEIEYTTYFLNSGSATASNVKICDRLFTKREFNPGVYGGTGKDVELWLGSNPVQYLTSANDPLVDRTQLYSPGAAVPTTCNLTGTNTDGTVVLDLTGTAGTGNPAITNMPFATGQGLPNNSYGYFRYRAIIK